MKPSYYPTLHRRSALGSTATVSHLVDQLLVLPTNGLHQDWAYVEDWCRRLTGSFSDVYVFTIPLYLPRQDPDGKWRVVSMFLVYHKYDHLTGFCVRPMKSSVLLQTWLSRHILQKLC